MNKLFYLIIPLLIIVASWFIFDMSRFLPIENSGNSVTSPEIDEMLDKSQELILADRYDEALDLLNRGISENSSVPILYNFRALVWSFKGDDDKAIVDYTSAINLAPKYHEAYSNRARAWARKGEVQKAIEDYNRALNIYSDDSSAIFYRGSAYSKLGDYEKAFSDYKKVIELDPKWAEESFTHDKPADPIYLAALAEHFAELGNFQKAIIIQERAIELHHHGGDEKDISKHKKRLECYRNRKL